MARRWIQHARLACLATIVALAQPAGALQITGFGVTFNTSAATNTANALTNTGQNHGQIASSLSSVAPGGPIADTPGSSTSFSARYAALLAADRQATTSSTVFNATSAYKITFTVDNPTGGTYQIDVDTLRVGAITYVDDTTGSATATSTLGAVTGRVNSGSGPVVESNLALAAVGPTGNAQNAFNQSSTTHSITSSALSQTYVIDFAWSSSATSATDEAAIRMGISGSVASMTADDYPGVGARTAANDGHFASFTVTYLVPEPGTAALLGLGIAGLAALRRGKRRL